MGSTSWQMAVDAPSSAIPWSPPAPSGTLGSIAHVVILCQENRSYDHYFGTLKGGRGFNDDHAATVQKTTRTVFSQANAGGSLYTPWRLNTATTSAQWMGDVAHDRSSGTAAWNKGRNDIPYHYALADAFTLCDNYYCSARTSTNPNRLFMMTGTNDPQGKNGGPATYNGFEYGTLTWSTYPEALQAAGVSWRLYQQADNFDNNALAWFKQFGNLATNSPLYNNGIQTRALADFQNDVLQNRLPAVSWVIAPAHPSTTTRPPPTHRRERSTNMSRASRRAWGGGGVPTIVCSPWSRGGWIASEVFDHTSILQFLEKWTGVNCPHISQWRRAVCGDLTSCFDFTSSTSAFPVLPNTALLVSQANAQKALPAPRSGARGGRAYPIGARAGTAPTGAVFDGAFARLAVDECRGWRLPRGRLCGAAP
jgi:phospholipase C